jgi:small subunit ribosomal protein S30e
MQLFVRAQELHALELTGSETVGQVVGLVAEREGLDIADVAAYCGGLPLDHGALLSACASDLSTLELEVRMLGGKVHGSLARAGKVKGQTPKVEKGEKKKKKTGRAKRRMQYNRRFVNVVATFGRKKGPNSNTQ